jgi:hypothetical protein
MLSFGEMALAHVTTGANGPLRTWCLDLGPTYAQAANKRRLYCTATLAQNAKLAKLYADAFAA